MSGTYCSCGDFHSVLLCFQNYVALTGILKFLSSFLESRHDSPQFFIVCSLEVYGSVFSAKSVIVCLFVLLF